MGSFAKTFTSEFINELQKFADKRNQTDVQKYFKFKLRQVIGSGTKPMQSVVKSFLPKVKAKSYEDIIACTDEMLKTDIYEVQLGGIDILYKSKLKNRDDETFQHSKCWFEQGLLDNWASVDMFCCHILALCVENSEKLQNDLFLWTSSGNNWMRRAAAVSYVPHARHGKLYDRVYQAAEVLHKDNDEFVNKGLGWALRDTAMADKERFVKFVETHRDIARITLRYAIEKFEKDERKYLLNIK